MESRKQPLDAVDLPPDAVDLPSVSLIAKPQQHSEWMLFIGHNRRQVGFEQLQS
jgi:hypothetical protein